MRKWIVLVLSLSLLYSFLMPAALAEVSLQTQKNNLILAGHVVAETAISLKAPFGGAVEDFAVREGDTVKAFDALFSLSTKKIYAPCSGAVGGIRAQAGDSASYVQSRYGALCFIEPDNGLIISDTAHAYDKAENRLIHMGETVYIKSTSNSKHTGTGVVTAIDGTDYTVEVQSGNLLFEESVSLYRKNGFSSVSRIGRGEISRIDPIPVTGDGAVLRAAVSEGSHVTRGDLLFEMVAGDLEGLLPASGEVAAGRDGVIADILVSPGQTVSRGQVMAMLHAVGSSQIAANVSEKDVGELKVGQEVSIEFKSLEGKLYPGTITSISAIGYTVSGSTEFTVYIDFKPDDAIREGLSATVYCTEE